MYCGQVIANERYLNPYDFVDPGEDITIRGQPMNPTGIYKVAVNDYIANGGSGFKVLKRNTTQQDTGVPLRDALIDHIQTLPHCGEWERTTGLYCDNPDDFSQSICRQIGGEGRIPGQPTARGPYSDVPCVVSAEDGRIKRKTSDNLDQLDDQREDEVQP